MYIIRKGSTPEHIMKPMFNNLFETQKGLRVALGLYEKRMDESKADAENIVNINKAIQLLSQAYDEISAIWENDINV